MDLKLDEGLKTLIESGKEKGYLTYSQVNEYLPDDAVNPEKLDQLLMLLEEQGIELIDEAEADERESEHRQRQRRRRPTKSMPSCATSISRRHRRGRRRPAHRRPGADVPDADGRDPAADPQGGNRAGQEDRGDPQALPPPGAGMRLRPGPASSRRSSACTPTNCPSTAPSRSRSPRTSKRTRSSSACRTTSRRSSTCSSRTSRTSPGSLDERLREEERKAAIAAA